MHANPFRPLRSVGPLDDDAAIEYDLVDDFEAQIAGLFVDYDNGPSLLKIAAVWLAWWLAVILIIAAVVVGAVLAVKAAS